MTKSRIEDVENRISELLSNLERLKASGEKRLKLIENGAKFGYHDYQDPFGNAYFPCKLLKVIDHDKFIIKVIEPSINEITETDVFGLFICGED